MKIILRQAVAGIGEAGTIKDVADGYARNLLLPKGLAEIATRDKIKAIAAADAVKTEALAAQKGEFEAILSKIPEAGITFKKKVTKTGKLFAAISPGHIATELNALFKTEIKPEMIKVEKQIKEVGDHVVDLVLHPEVFLVQ